MRLVKTSKRIYNVIRFMPIYFSIKYRFPTENDTSNNISLEIIAESIKQKFKITQIGY